MIRRSPPLALLGLSVAVWVIGRTGVVAWQQAAIAAVDAAKAPPVGGIALPPIWAPVDLLVSRASDEMFPLPAGPRPALAPHLALAVPRTPDRAMPAATIAVTADETGGQAISRTQLALLARILSPSGGQTSGLVGAFPRAGDLRRRDIGFARARAMPFAAAAPAAQDRWTASLWAFHRAGGLAPPLPGSGALGGSQAGARLAMRIDAGARAEAYARLSTAGVEAGSTEGAVGIAVRPLRSVPVRLAVERRQALSGEGGRSAFAAYAVGGVSSAALPAGWRLDGYGAAGVIGTRRADGFIEGFATATRPIAHVRGVTVSGGGGVWGGAQRDASRLDVDPTLSARIDRVSAPRLQVDYRQRVAGGAAPGSGVAVTLAADF